MNSLKIVSIVILGLASAAVTLAGVGVGDAAPGFSLTDAKGGTVNLADIKGRVVVLEWTNPNCPFVKRHYQEGSMKNLTSAYSDAGVVWLTVNSTHSMDRAANADFAAAQGIGWPLLVDQDGTVGRAYGAATTPHMFVVDATGKIVYAGAIDDDPRGAKAAAARTNYVAKALDEVLAGKPVSTPETTPYGCSVKYR